MTEHYSAPDFLDAYTSAELFALMKSAANRADESSAVWPEPRAPADFELESRFELFAAFDVVAREEREKALQGAGYLPVAMSWAA